MNKKTAVSLAEVWRNPVHFLAFGLGAGMMPVARGTFGTLLAVPVCFAWAGCRHSIRSVTLHFQGDRTAVRRQAVLAALQGLLEDMGVGEGQRLN